MSELTDTQRRVLLVLERIAQAVTNDEYDADVWSIELEASCVSLMGQDFFGTEGQSDPRGDWREGHWSMDRVQGVDG